MTTSDRARTASTGKVWCWADRATINGTGTNFGNTSAPADGAINGAWQFSQGVLTIEGTHTMDSLVFSSQQLKGSGTLTIDGALSLTDSAVLHIDLGSDGASDKLVIIGGVLWNGELSLWGGVGTALHLGDVFSFASFGQRLSNASFDKISWNGQAANPFDIEYTANGIQLRVTSVPEPATYALYVLGLGLLGARKLRRQVRSSP